MKEVILQVQDHLLPLFLYLLVGLVWIGAGSLIYLTTQLELQQQINETWEQAIQLDCRNRLTESGNKYTKGNSQEMATSSISTFTMAEQEKLFDRETLPAPANEIERDNWAFQAYLSIKNPINPVRLDSLFNTLLNKKNISAPTAVFYLNNAPDSLPRCSVQDTTFFARAFATKGVKTTIDNSIVLRGFVGISWINYIQYDLSFYLLWLCSGILTIIIIVYQYPKKSQQQQQSIPKRSAIVEPNTAESVKQPVTIYYHKYNCTLVYDQFNISLTPLENELFLCLIENENYFQDYESIIARLWPKDGDKKKLEQQRRNLKKKLDKTSGIAIEAIWGKGYQLVIAENITISSTG